MGNCLSTCASSSVPQEKDSIINYQAEPITSPIAKDDAKDNDSQLVKQSPDGQEVCHIVQKELQALQSQISHSQAVLASLKFSFYESQLSPRSLELVHRTTQTPFNESLPRSLENVSNKLVDKSKHELSATSCPAIVSTVNIAVQTDWICSPKVVRATTERNEFFLPPIDSPIIDYEQFIQNEVADRLSRLPEPSGTVDLEIYRSCRKLSVLPEEEVVCESPQDAPQPVVVSPTWKAARHQAYSLESYLTAISEHGPGNLPRQMSEPTPGQHPGRSTCRPLHLTSKPAQDSGLGGSPTLSQPGLDRDGAGPLLVPSPETPFRTPPPDLPTTSSSSTSLSFQTPSPPESCSPTSKSLPDSDSIPLRPLLAVLLDGDRIQTSVYSEQSSSCCSPLSLAPQDTLTRVPSRRRLVRSLARVSSELPFDITEPGPKEIAMEEQDQTEVRGPVAEPEGNQPPFPALGDQALKQLGVWAQDSLQQSDSNLTEDEIESKYTSLVIAFKTDRMTLHKRLELQNRQRDNAEVNLTNELSNLSSSLQLMLPNGKNHERDEAFHKIRDQIKAIQKISNKISSTAEAYGAVQQENRLSKAVDIILRHVENLKQAFEKEKADHEETRKLLKDNRVSPDNTSDSKVDLSTKRRASIATTLVKGNEKSESRAHPRKGSLIRRLTGTFSNSFSEEDKTKDSETESLNICSSCLIRRNSKPFLHCTHMLQHSDQDTDSEERWTYKPLPEEKPVIKKQLTRYKFRKRPSFCDLPWMVKAAEHLSWLRPLENYSHQLRYTAAAACVFAAVVVLLTSIFAPQYE